MEELTLAIEVVLVIVWNLQGMMMTKLNQTTTHMTGKLYTIFFKIYYVVLIYNLFIVFRICSITMEKI